MSSATFSLNSLSQLEDVDGSDGVDPQDLGDALQNILDVELPTSSNSMPVSSERIDMYVALIQGISLTIIAEFLSPKQVTWEAISSDRVPLAERSLEVIVRLTTRVPELFCLIPDLSKILLARLSALIHTCNKWVASLADDEGAREHARSLKVVALRVLTKVLTFATDLQLSHRGLLFLGRRSVNLLLGDIHDILRETIDTNPLVYPTWVNLSNRPRVSGVAPSDPQDTALEINDNGEYLEWFIDIVDIFSRLSVTTEKLQPNIVPLHRKTLELANALFELILSPPFHVPGNLHADLIARTLMITKSLSAHSSHGLEISTTFLYRVCTWRLRNGADTDLQNIDRLLCEDLRSLLTRPARYVDMDDLSLACETLTNVHDREHDNLLLTLACSFIQSHITYLTEDMLQSISSLKGHQSEQISTLMFTVNKRNEAALGDANMDDSSFQWRESVLLAFPELKQYNLKYPPSHLSNEQWGNEIIGGIAEVKIGPSDHENRDISSVLVDLSKAICTMTHLGRQGCTEGISLHLQLVKPVTALVLRLLGSPSSQKDAATLRLAFDCLQKAYTHETNNCTDHDSRALWPFLTSCMSSSSRSLRLGAGRLSAGIVRADCDRLTHTVTEGSLLHLIVRMADQERDCVQETVLITLGEIAKFVDESLLEPIIGCFIRRLGSRSPLLRSLTHIQLLLKLLAVAKSRNKSSYALLSPFLHHIAILVINNVSTSQLALQEVCVFLSRSTREFLDITLVSTLPELFARRNISALRFLARELGKDIAGLFIRAPHDILAKIFLLHSSFETEKSLESLLNGIRDTRQRGEDLRADKLVKSCIVHLLGELVVSLGDEDHEKSQLALEAIRKVDNIVTLVSDPENHPESAPDCLQQYVLAIVSHLNDLLQSPLNVRSISVKRQAIRGLGRVLDVMGPAIVSPQIMATLQASISVSELSDVSLDMLKKFVTSIQAPDFVPYVAQTTAAIASQWQSFGPYAREIALEVVHHMTSQAMSQNEYLSQFASFFDISALADVTMNIQVLRRHWSGDEWLDSILKRVTNDNEAVATCALKELKHFMLAQEPDFMRKMTTGDAFDSLVSRIIDVLLRVASRDTETPIVLRNLAYECFGALGAVDPDRVETIIADDANIMLFNFEDEGESVKFALHLICDVLVGAFRATSDTNFQGYLAYAIQELLRFCEFSPELAVSGSGNSLPIKIRNRWKSLPPHVVETVAPLLSTSFQITVLDAPQAISSPLYHHFSTYREWIQHWTTHLISRTVGIRAQRIFHVFRQAVVDRDVGVAHHLLPHLVLNILLSGSQQDVSDVQSEICAILEDQVTRQTGVSPEKRDLSAQSIFLLMDHLTKWIRGIRQELAHRRSEQKFSRHAIESGLTRVDSIIMSVDKLLMAEAAFQCKAYARSLMSFERLLDSRSSTVTQRQAHWERLHEIYAHLDEPDGMEGVSSSVLAPTLEHQIRQHESTGRWTSAQSCWEVRLQQNSDNIEHHLGLVRCLRNLGQYSTLRTHIRGVLGRIPEWQPAMIGFQIEAAWMVNDWNDVQTLIGSACTSCSEALLGRVLLAMRVGDNQSIKEALLEARLHLGSSIAAPGKYSYRRVYPAIVNLHVVHELEAIHTAIRSKSSTPSSEWLNLTALLSYRLGSTLPNFKNREPILNMRRTAFQLHDSLSPRHRVTEVGKSWLTSAKFARKAGYWQTAYNAVLQAKQLDTPYTFIQTSRLLRATGEPLKALREVELALQNEPKSVKGTQFELTRSKALTIRARWMHESERYEANEVMKAFKEATKNAENSESAQFHYGHYQDECFHDLPPEGKLSRGPIMNVFTIKCYVKAVQYGSKYAYQTIPRLLTIWLDMGEEDHNRKLNRKADDPLHANMSKVNREIDAAIRETAVYMWLPAFPQIVSRIGHPSNSVYTRLSKIILAIIQSYPQQALWQFISVVKSNKPERAQRGQSILDQVKSNPANSDKATPKLVDTCVSMVTELLDLCEFTVSNDKKSLNMSRDFPRLARLAPSRLIVPLQDSLTPTLPPSSSMDISYRPFSDDPPTIAHFNDEVEVMKSLAKPRKISVKGSNGLKYRFLGKPKDDLRKDARLMDFNSIINKLLRTDSEARRRRLHIRTYSVITLNEECGFLQWVPNTIPLRAILLKLYERRRIPAWDPEVQRLTDIMKTASDAETAKSFQKDLLKIYPAVFHEWFLETFPEPSAWLTSRLAYSRTLAVMSMTGFILGLGDRHGENILLDNMTGDVVHVDFNCLFEKGRTLDVPERVPFRMTQNIVNGLGVTGAEGILRKASEVSMKLLRNNKDCLMSVLDAFIHDPLVEWEDEKRRHERNGRRERAAPDLKILAKNALLPIERKLQGRYIKYSVSESHLTAQSRAQKGVSVSNLVQMLIEEATDPVNLGKMYVGWAPWF